MAWDQTTCQWPSINSYTVASDTIAPRRRCAPPCPESCKYVALGLWPLSPSHSSAIRSDHEITSVRFGFSEALKNHCIGGLSGAAGV